MTRLADLQPGARLGDYEIVSILGGGGMGRVYKAWHPRLRRLAAIKVVGEAGPAEARRRFEREAQAVAALHHPSILSVYDYGEVEGEPYMVLEFMEMGSLADHQAELPLPPAEVVRILQPVALALDHAHRQGIVHRDVKPANIFLDAERRPVLGDFGLSRLASQATLTTSGTVTGTPSYVAPEQARGQPPTPATDIYSLAVTAFLLLTGELPFPPGGDALSVLYRHVNEPPPAPSSIRPGLAAAADAVLLRGLAKEPGDRWRTATAMVDALAAALGVERRAPRVTPAPAGKTMAPTAAGLVAVVSAALVIAGVAYLVTRPGGDGARARLAATPAASGAVRSISVVGTGVVRVGGPIEVRGRGLQPPPARATIFVVDSSSTAGPIKDDSLVGVQADGAFDETGQVNPALRPGRGLVEACNLDSAGLVVDSTCVKVAVTLTSAG